jgi:excinuclease ABC subunit A
MSKPKKAAPACIRLRGVRQNNLKNFDLDLPLGRLIVITGLSGSGKSSLAFDTLYAEGQRRYIETFSPYARQFFDRMDKPAVDRIENIPPAIAIEQRNAVRTTRSTVGTMTEVCEHMKALWHRLAQLHCRRCGQPVRPEPPQTVWTSILSQPQPTPNSRPTLSSVPSPNSNRLHDAAPAYLTANPSPTPKPNELLITFDLPLSDRLPWSEQLELLRKQGFQRLLTPDGIQRLEDLLPSPTPGPTPLLPFKSLTVVVDRLRPSPAHRARFIEACETAYHFGRGRLAVRLPDGSQRRDFSAGHHCASCDLAYREPSTALFSFNNPVGACPTCKGFGRVIGIDPDLALPDRSLTLSQGVVRPWQTATG